MGRTRQRTGAPLPKALACGLLEDEGRVLFLVVKDERGIERIELPCVVVPSGRSPFADIKEAFQKLTGIDGQVHEIVLQGTFNAGSRKRRQLVPAVALRVTARERRARPAPGYSGFRWLQPDEAKRQRLTRRAEWLLRAKKSLAEEHEREHQKGE